MMTFKNLYHGTAYLFKNFDDKYRGKGKGDADVKAFWFYTSVNNKDKAKYAASQYASDMKNNSSKLKRIISDEPSRYVYLVEINADEDVIRNENDNLNEDEIIKVKQKFNIDIEPNETVFNIGKKEIGNDILVYLNILVIKKISYSKEDIEMFIILEQKKDKSEISIIKVFDDKDINSW